MRLKNRKKSAAAIKSMKVGTDELKDLIKGAVKEAMGEEDDTGDDGLLIAHVKRLFLKRRRRRPARHDRSFHRLRRPLRLFVPDRFPVLMDKGFRSRRFVDDRFVIIHFRQFGTAEWAEFPIDAHPFATFRTNAFLRLPFRQLFSAAGLTKAVVILQGRPALLAFLHKIHILYLA